MKSDGKGKRKNTGPKTKNVDVRADDHDECVEDMHGYISMVEDDISSDEENSSSGSDSGSEFENDDQYIEEALAFSKEAKKLVSVMFLYTTTILDRQVLIVHFCFSDISQLYGHFGIYQTTLLII